MYTFTQSLARLAKVTVFSDLPDDVIYWASRAFADTVGCAIAGAGEAVVTTLASIIPSAVGSSMVFGQKERLHPLDAAQLNGVSAHALDFDDCNLEMDGHPSVSIVPALLAIADKLNCSGKELLAAYIVGVEAEIRLARVSNPAHANRGWHPTVTFGVIGAGVACGHLLKLDENKWPQQFASKFINCATVNLTPPKARNPLDALLTMPAQESATNLIALMQPNSIPSKLADVTPHLAKTK